MYKSDLYSQSLPLARTASSARGVCECLTFENLGGVLMKGDKRDWLLAAGCFFLLVAVASLAQADYDSADNRVPSPTYSSTNQVTYSTPAGLYSISSFFDVFTDIQRVSPPDTGTGQTNSFFDVFTEINLQGPGIPPGTRDATSQQTIHIDGVPNETWQSEMLQLDLSGGSLPASLMIRESPTLPSMGT